MDNLSGKIALITGGGSGIGLATAKLFLEKGAQVAIAGRDKTKLETNTKGAAGRDRLFIHATDVTKPDQVNKLVDAVVKHFGRIDILVNCAGTNIKDRAFSSLTPEIWQMMVATNLDSAFYCSSAVIPAMIQRKDGVIINISSVAGKRASPLGGIAYAAAKFGMTALGLGLAEEQKPHNIRVTNIYPGEVDTPILEKRPQPVTEEHRARILKPEDVAAAVLFVAAQPAHVSIPELIIKPTFQTYL